MNQNNRRNRRGKRAGGRRGQSLTSNLPQRAPSGPAPAVAVRQPNLYPRVAVTRFVSGLYDVTTDGVNPTFAAFNFSLNDVAGYTEMTAMFQSYCIETVELWYRPEYTVLSDASALSTAVNVDFYSAIDTTDSTAPTSVDAVNQYQSCAHTSITQTHYRKIRPSYLIDSALPSCALISTASPSVNWYGIKIAIPPTGTAMTFRTVAKFKIALTGLK